MKKHITFIVISVFFAVMMTITAFAASALELQTLDKINEIRTAHGLSTVRHCVSLESTSAVRADEITSEFSHTRPDGTEWYTVNEDIQFGENLAEGYDSADEVVDAWMASPEHRANILRADFITCAISTVTKNGRTYWAQEFGIK